MTTCTAPALSGKTCIQSFAEGWVLATDLCPTCTLRLMAALDSLGEPLMWAQAYRRRADGEMPQRPPSGQASRLAVISSRVGSGHNPGPANDD